MVVPIIRETLDLLEIKDIQVSGIPCQISVSDWHSLIVSSTEFGHILFAVICDNKSPIQWSQSDIIEYFTDEDTQFFIENNNSCFSKSGDSVGYSIVFSEEKIQVFMLVDFITKSIEELNRFIDNYTPV